MRVRCPAAVTLVATTALVSLLASMLATGPATAVPSPLTGSMGAAAPQGKAPAPVQNRIAYASGCDIWYASPTGAGKTNITPGTTTTCESYPTISYDGRFIAFDQQTVTPQGPLNDIWVHNVATGRSVQVTDDGRSRHPDFSPVDYRIAFSRGYASTLQLTNIFTMTRTGADVTRWTKDVAPAPGSTVYRINRKPEWSANARQIYFVSSRDGYSCRRDRGEYDDIFQAFQMYRTTAAGALTRLTNDRRLNVDAVSVRGASRAYTASRLPASTAAGYCQSEPTNEFSLYVDGAALTRSSFGKPTWSSASRILFGTVDTKVGSVAASGGTVRRLFAGSLPDWGRVP